MQLVMTGVAMALMAWWGWILIQPAWKLALDRAKRPR